MLYPKLQEDIFFIFFLTQNIRRIYHVISDFISGNVITFAALEVDVKTEVTSSRGFHTAPFHFLVGLPLAAIYLRSPLVYFPSFRVVVSWMAKPEKDI